MGSFTLIELQKQKGRKHQRRRERFAATRADLEAISLPKIKVSRDPSGTVWADRLPEGVPHPSRQVDDNSSSKALILHSTLTLVTYG